jgi:hypothetical protein
MLCYGRFPRGVATSTDSGETFGGLRFASDTSGGVSCLAALLAPPLSAPPLRAPPTNVTLYFSHPASNSRKRGVMLASRDLAHSWTEVRRPQTKASNRGTLQTLSMIERPAVYPALRAQVTSATPEAVDAPFAYSSLSWLGAAARAGGAPLGLTYETGDEGCEAAAPACRIVFRSFAAPQL